MERVINFSAGPSALPVEVLQKAQSELLIYSSCGMSVMEMSHRSKMYLEIFEEAKAGLISLMNIPSNYEVLFLQGGASSQFSMVPLNLLKTGKADYIKTGEFATKALKEAKRYGEITVVASSEDRNFSYIPELTKEMFSKDADYVHITTNNTIYGTKYSQLPDTGNVPLVADMSSNILSQEYDINDFGLIYAGAQKNIGPAGLTVVIIRNDLLGFEKDFTPSMYSYKALVKGDSMVNTPPTYGIYIAKLVFDWIKEQGGVSAIHDINKQKAALLYDYIDNSKLFKGTAEPEHRSIMNVTFVTGSEETDKKFIKEAEQNGLVNLAGHRAVGGMRASIYNAVTVDNVKKLIEFMKKFELSN